jgi:hypothetical protein
MPYEIVAVGFRESAGQGTANDPVERQQVLMKTWTV